MKKTRYIIYLDENNEVSDIRMIWKASATMYGMEKADAQDVIDALKPKRVRRPNEFKGCYP